jgi:recombination protein RecR
MIAEPIRNLIRELKRLPGIGEKTAMRLALHILAAPTEHANLMARALTELKEKIIPCSICNQFTEADPCAICSSYKRDQKTVCVIEDQASLMAMENTRSFFGVYHLLGGRMSPMDGIGPDELKMEMLKTRVIESGIEEVVLATSPNVDGEATALYIKRLLTPLGVKITRIARGIPMGGDIEFTDALTLGRALESRSDY